MLKAGESKLQRVRCCEQRQNYRIAVLSNNVFWVMHTILRGSTEKMQKANDSHRKLHGWKIQERTDNEQKYRT